MTLHFEGVHITQFVEILLYKYMFCLCTIYFFVIELIDAILFLLEWIGTLFLDAISVIKSLMAIVYKPNIFSNTTALCHCEEKKKKDNLKHSEEGNIIFFKNSICKKHKIFQFLIKNSWFLFIYLCIFFPWFGGFFIYLFIFPYC